MVVLVAVVPRHTKVRVLLLVVLVLLDKVIMVVVVLPLLVVQEAVVPVDLVDLCLRTMVGLEE
jgi:hypothetical protein